MNEHLYVNAHGLRLIQEYEGAPRLKARLCEGNSFELSYGVTFDLNGNPFNAESTCTPEESDTLFRNALQIFERGVRELVTVPLNNNQFSGLVAFAWNIGLTNFAGSSVLRRVNENRMDDAAACFGMWIFATNGAGHKQALRGLLRRRYSESALFMGYSWTVACSDDAIALQREIPDPLPGTDRVIYKTPFKDVLAVAQKYPLENADELILTNKAEPRPSSPAASAGQPGVSAPSPLPAAPANETAKVSPDASVASKIPPIVNTKPAETVPSGPAVKAGPAAPNVPAKAQPVPSPVGAPITSEKAKREPPPKPPVVMPPSVQVNAQPDMGPTTRTMWVSKRFWGGVLIIGGRLIIAADVTGTFAPAVKAFIGDGILMDWGTGVIVTVLGEMIFHQGERKAEGPMDTPKRIALMTPTP